MRMILIAVTLCLSVGEALAGSPLQGRWEITMPHDPGATGDLVVDAEGRVLLNGASATSGKSVHSRGYVSRLTGAKAEITLTDGDAVARMRCTLQSADVLDCDDVSRYGVSATYSLRRVGPGPANLLTEH
jgi:hypothetical protein